MRLEDIKDHIIEFVLGLLAVGTCLMLIALTIWIVVACFLNVRDTMATIKIKEKIAENGIEITTTQVQELLGDDK